MQYLTAADLLSAGTDCVPVRSFIFTDALSHHGKRIKRICGTYRFASFAEAVTYLKSLSPCFVYEYDPGELPRYAPDPERPDDVTLHGAFGRADLPKVFEPIIDPWSVAIERVNALPVATPVPDGFTDESPAIAVQPDGAVKDPDMERFERDLDTIVEEADQIDRLEQEIYDLLDEEDEDP